MDQIDQRAYAEYCLWFAFTASIWPPEEQRFVAAKNYFLARGFQVLL